MSPKLTIPLTLIFLLTVRTASAQSDEVKFLIDTCITIMKNNSVKAKSMDWKQLQKSALSKASNVNDGNQLGIVMRYIYKSIDDFHGAFFYKDSTFKWKRNERVVSDSVMKEWKKGIAIKSMILENNMGYLRVPYMSFNGKEDADKNAQRLNDSLCVLLEKNVKGIVLDLRLNGGGAMYPMMLGLEQLLGTGKIGAFVSNKNESWFIKDHNFLLDTTVLTSLAPKCSVNAERLPVVLLIGSSTGSSGEFLVMAFKGRKNTLFLGTETAGYITAVGGFPINNAAYMYLSTGYGMDRAGRVYKEAIKPDILNESPDSFNDIKNDKKVQAAVKWLLNSGK
jgi:C-terminal processing protease CtpA/Prc